MTEKHKPTSEIQNSGTIPSEIKDIMNCLGRNTTEGNVKGDHLGKILFICQKPPMRIQNDYHKLISYLALVCGMNVRYVKESYLNGLEVSGIIEVYDSNNNKFFKWIGMKAFERNNGDK